MATYQVIDPYVLVNGEKIAITPNSWKSNAGYPEVAYSGLTSGEDGQDVAITTNNESRFGKCSFEVPSTVNSFTLIDRWKALTGTINITAVATEGGKDYILEFSNASLVNDPEATGGSDAKRTFEFNSSPMSKISV